jgi:uncharacterized protein (TIGR03086 family)
MEPLEVLERAGRGFSSTLSLVSGDGWAGPTGDGEWTVRVLVDHVTGGNRMATVILGGATREEGLAQYARSVDDADPVAAFEASSVDLAAAFAAPGALDRMVAHPAMQMPGSQLLGFRTVEYALHGWDLARAIGADDAIDPDVVEALWAALLPMAPMLASTGLFGAGPSGDVPLDAPLQERVLDLSGRRP